MKLKNLKVTGLTAHKESGGKDRFSVEVVVRGELRDKDLQALEQAFKERGGVSISRELNEYNWTLTIREVP